MANSTSLSAPGEKWTAERLKSRFGAAGEGASVLSQEGPFQEGPPKNKPTQREPGLIPAAVLVPLIPRQEGTTLLLIRRAEGLDIHAGQFGFPGGHCEVQDVNAEATALRETREELGLDHKDIEPLGHLGEVTTRTGYLITPVVALLYPPFELVLDECEVAETFQFPLSVVLDPARHERYDRDLDDGSGLTHAITHDGRFIWGATAAMLIALYERLNQI